MNNRTAQILEAAIQGFITTGEPVSSGWLFDHYDFGIKPAMIRLELDGLEDDGYLEQPYHSAGRMPTDAGYEFFARQILGNVPESRETSPRETVLRETTSSREAALHELLEERAWSDLSHRLSAELGLLGVVVDIAEDAIYKAGLENLINHLNWENRDEICSAVRDFEEMDGRLTRAPQRVGKGPKVFIGKKSPVTKSEYLSAVGGNYRIGNGAAAVSIFAIGPKRMDYRKVIRVFKSL